jgi:hypothetical protein
MHRCWIQIGGVHQLKRKGEVAVDVDVPVPGLVPGIMLVIAGGVSATALSFVGTPGVLVGGALLLFGIPGVVLLLNAALAARRGLDELKRKHHLD